MKASNNPFPSALFEEQADAPDTPAAGYSRIFLKADGLYVVDDAGTVTGPLASAAGGGYTEGCSVYNSTDTPIAAAGFVALDFDSERYDTDGMHESVTNPDRVTIKTAGKYVITFGVRWESNTTGIRIIAIEKNGAGDTAHLAVDRRAASTVSEASISAIADLDVDDYVRGIVYQTSGGELDVDTYGLSSPVLSVQRIG